MFEFERIEWTDEDYEKYIEELKQRSDEKYRKFHSSLAGEGETELIGVRSPILREIAKQISKGNVKDFLKCCKSRYYEEIVIEGMAIGNLKVRYEELVLLVDKYVPKISSWAINDSFCTSLKQVKKDKKLWFEHIASYLEMDKQYTSKLVDEVEINYKSLLSVSKISNIDYDYTLKLTIYGNYNENNESSESNLWEKEYILMDKI